MTLTAKQQRFVEEYLLDLNATQAAVRAGYTHGSTQGPRLLANVRVMREITTRRDKRSERTQIDADWMLARLAMEAEADLGDLYNEDGTMKPVKEWPKIWRQGLVSGLDVEEIRSGDDVSSQIRKVKLSDRVKRLELIGRHIDVQAFADRLNVNHNTLGDDELLKELAEVRERLGRVIGETS